MAAKSEEISKKYVQLLLTNTWNTLIEQILRKHLVLCYKIE